MRIVSLLPSATEILFALGAGDEVVGVTFECDHPAEARTRGIVSTSTLPEGLAPSEIDTLVRERLARGEDLYHLDAGVLADLDPDLIITQDLCAVCAVDVSEVKDALVHLGCKARVLTLDPMRLDEVIASVATVGTATGRGAAAAELISSLRARLTELAAQLDGARSRPTLVLEWTDPPFSAGHWVPDMVVAAGGADMLGRPGERSETITWDRVQATGAEVVVVAACATGSTAPTALPRTSWSPVARRDRARAQCAGQRRGGGLRGHRPRQGLRHHSCLGTPGPRRCPYQG